jgi:pyruvate dehydrogenase E2 component (dihydrolipoamide acetyltransferase)
MKGIIPVTLPKWGLEMAEGTVTAWHIAEGARAEKGADLCDVETDKIVNTMEVPDGGVLRRILIPAGETVPVGALIAVIAAEATAEAEIAAFIAGFKPVDASFEPKDAAPPPAPEPAPVAATPLARRTAADIGVDLAAVQGSGPKGKVRKDDVARAARQAAPAAPVHASPIAAKFAAAVGLSLAGIAGTGRKGRVSLADAQAAAQAAGLWSPPAPVLAPAPAPAAPAPAEQPFTPLRKAIARALTRSKTTVPHFYTAMDVETDALTALRADLNAAGEGARVSVNDLILRACGMALHAHPAVNVHVSEAGTTAFPRADIAMAVSIDGGLVTPVIRDAGGRGVRAIAADAAALAARARDRALTADEIEGATFTVSNLGMFGVRAFDAIVMAPQAAILAVGAVRREAREAPGGMRFAGVMTLTLSADHRAVDGALAAQFLATLRDLIERPARLLL